MWRALFLAIGIFLCIVGVECLVIDKAFLAAGESSGGLMQSGPQVVVPPAWAPFSLLAAGAVVILYSFTIPKLVNSG